MKICSTKDCKNPPVVGIATIDSLWTLTKEGYADEFLNEYGGGDINEYFCREHLSESDLYQEEFEEALAEKAANA